MFMKGLDRDQPEGQYLKIFCDPVSHAGAIIVFYDENEQNNALRDMCFMLVNCTDPNWHVMPEDVIAQLILKRKLTTDGTNLMLEW